VEARLSLSSQLGIQGRGGRRLGEGGSPARVISKPLNSRLLWGGKKIWKKKKGGYDRIPTLPFLDAFAGEEEGTGKRRGGKGEMDAIYLSAGEVAKRLKKKEERQTGPGPSIILP